MVLLLHLPFPPWVAPWVAPWVPHGSPDGAPAADSQIPLLRRGETQWAARPGAARFSLGVPPSEGKWTMGESMGDPQTIGKP